jgi:hypothetical protein
MSVEVKDETAGFITDSNAEPKLEVQEQSKQQGVESANSSEEASNADDSQSGASDKDRDADSEQSDDDEQEAGNSAADKHDKHDKKKAGASKRISELVKQREEQKRINEELQKQIQEIKSKGKSKPDAGKEPKEDDFDDYEQYLDALEAYDNSHTAKNESEQAKDNKADSKPVELTSSQKTAMAILQERFSTSEKPSDFNEVALVDDFPVTPEMIEGLAECEDPVKVLYHLGKNKDLAAKIASGTAVQQAREIARLDFTVVSKPQKPIKTTNAPDPIAPVRGQDTHQKALHEMSFSEFEAADRARNSGKKSSW